MIVWKLNASTGGVGAFFLGCVMGLCGICGIVPTARANGYGESGSWGFLSNQDRVNKGYVLDMIEKKKNGYYNAIKSTYNNNTYIDKQVNCSLSTMTTGTSGSSSTQASTSSPVLNNTGYTAANGTANTASNGLSQASLTGVFNTNATPPGSLSNGQSSSGALSTSVAGSTNSTSTGQVAANGGVTDQVLNSQQSNSGTLTSSISASTACTGMVP